MATFQTFWNGKLGPIHRLCLQSFLDYGHDVHLYTYNDIAGLPRCVSTINANRIYSDKLFGWNRDHLRTFSNLFRFELLRQKGGWWIDTDVICLTDNIPDYERFFAWVDSDVINVATMQFLPNDALMVECVKQWRKNDNPDKSGPGLFTKILKETGRTGEAQPLETCNPIHWKQAADILDKDKADDLEDKIKGSMFLHLWETVFHWQHVSLIRRPPAGSLLEHFADKHGWH